MARFIAKTMLVVVITSAALMSGAQAQETAVAKNLAESCALLTTAQYAHICRQPKQPTVLTGSATDNKKQPVSIDDPKDQVRLVDAILDLAESGELNVISIKKFLGWDQFLLNFPNYDRASISYIIKDTVDVDIDISRTRLFNSQRKETKFAIILNPKNSCITGDLLVARRPEGLFTRTLVNLNPYSARYYAPGATRPPRYSGLVTFTSGAIKDNVKVEFLFLGGSECLNMISIERMEK